MKKEEFEKEFEDTQIPTIKKVVEESKIYSRVSEMKVKERDLKADQFDDDTIPMNLIGDMNQEGEMSLSSEMKSTEVFKADQDAHLFFQAAWLMVGAKEVVDIPQVAKNKQPLLKVKRVAEPFNLFGISNGNKNAKTIGPEEQCDNNSTSSKPEYLWQLSSEEISKKISQHNELRKRKALAFEALIDKDPKRRAEEKYQKSTYKRVQNIHIYTVP